MGNGWRKTVFVSNKKSIFGEMNVDFKEIFLRVQPAKTSGSEEVATVRFIDEPVVYYTHWPNKREGKSSISVPFFDAPFNKMGNRNCFTTIQDGEIIKADCPWCNEGYSRQLKCMANVIYREGNCIKLLDVSSKALDIVFDWAEENGKDPSDWNEPRPYWRIKATRGKGNPGNITWSVLPREEAPLNEDELQIIKELSINLTTQEEEAGSIKLWPKEYFTKPTQIAESPKKSDQGDNESKIYKPSGGVYTPDSQHEVQSSGRVVPETISVPRPETVAKVEEKHEESSFNEVAPESSNENEEATEELGWDF